MNSTLVEILSPNTCRWICSGIIILVRFFHLSNSFFCELGNKSSSRSYHDQPTRMVARMATTRGSHKTFRNRKIGCRNGKKMVARLKIAEYA